MSDKFFDKDNNFILWKDKGDLTEASKYVGDNRSSIGVGESLVTKIAKGKIDIGRTYGLVDSDSLEVNWGKCGGTEDVIVTYNEGDDLWIPKAFLASGFNSDGSRKASATNKTDVGYKWSGYDSSIAVWKLPQNLGEYLYNNAEDLKDRNYYGLSSASQGHIYKGIAMYPDTVSDWSYSSNWGIGIRKKSDLVRMGWNDDGTYKTTSFSSKQADIDATMDDDSYYLVAQIGTENEGESYFLYNQLTLFNIDDTGTDHLWLRSCKDLTSIPSATNQGAKYTCPKSICKKRGVIERALTVNWGKCGGESTDTIVTYNEGEPLWIPKLFLTNGSRILYDSSSTSYGLLFWTLPKEIGKYLYEVAESNTTDIDDYSSSSNNPTNAMYHNYKGIAIYSDNPRTWENPSQWGVGIRKKSDIGVYGHINGVPTKCSNATAMETDSRLTGDDYYLVLQDYNSSGASTLLQNCSATTVDGGTPTSDHIYLRKYRDMTAEPSATNMGSKFLCDPKFCNKDLTTYTETKDSLTSDLCIEHPTLPTPNEDQVVIDWGAGIKTYYKYGEPMYIPRAFLNEGFTTFGAQNMSEGYNVAGATFAPVKDNIGDHVGYQTWFGNDDKNGKTERQTTSTLWISVYRLPYEIGEYLYNCAENNLGVHNDYSSTVLSSSGSNHTRNYKGIAIYPDNPKDWSMSEGWGVGIRKKSDLNIIGYTDSMTTTTKQDTTSDYACLSTFSQYQALDSNAYYLVCQMSRSGSKDTYTGHKDSFPNDEPVWMRSFNTMTLAPNSDNMGKKMVFRDLKSIGGKIFYIDSTNNGASYVFYDSNKKEIKNWTDVASLSDAVYYEVIGIPSSDKFYVFDNELATLRDGTWTYKEGGTNKYEQIFTTPSATGAIGQGKINTQTIMAKDNGKYVTGKINGINTIWYVCDEANNSKKSGCDDWFIPSKDELDAIRTSTVVPSNWFYNSIWTSSEDTNNTAYHWLLSGSLTTTYKGNNMNCVLIRSF